MPRHRPKEELVDYLRHGRARQQLGYYLADSLRKKEEKEQYVSHHVRVNRIILLIAACVLASIGVFFVLF